MKKIKFHEEKYVELFKTIEKIRDNEDKKSIDENDDYDLGFLVGKLEAYDKVLKNMAKEIISWNYDDK